MENVSLDFSKAQLDKLFPYYLIIDADMIIQSCGKAMSDTFSIDKDTQFSSLFFITKARNNPDIWKTLISLTGEEVTIQNTSKGILTFVGIIEYLENKKSIIFLGALKQDVSNKNDLKRGAGNNSTPAIPSNQTAFQNAFSTTIEFRRIIHQISLLTSEIIEASDLIDPIGNCLSSISEYCKADQAFISENQDNHQLGITLSTNSDSAKSVFFPQRKSIANQTSEFSSIFRSIPKIIDMKYLVIASSDVSDDSLKTKLDAHLIKSLLIVPIIRHKSLWGVIGLYDCQSARSWNEEEILLLQNLAHSITAAFKIKQSNYILRVQEEKYKSIISNANLGLIEVDKNDFIQFCNDSFIQISGYTLSELRGKKASELFIGVTHQEFKEQIFSAQPESEAKSFELLTTNKAGEPRWWLISSTKNFNEKDDEHGAIIICLDISDQKTMSAKLESALLKSHEASEAKESFLANMSHEIRTPLNGIIGMIRELGKEKNLTPVQTDYIGSAMKASSHLLSVVNNILDITKIEARELKLDGENFNIAELIDDVKAILKSQAEQKGINLHVHRDNNVPRVFIGDTGRIRQILINLAGNAVKFTEEGEVSISCSDLKKNSDKQIPGIHIVIKDTGVGMSVEYLENIFDKFHQEDSSISRKFGGTGLGLFITKQLIELMNGEIAIESKKGIGSKITVDIPLEIGDESKIKQKEKLDKSYSLDGAKILLIEDNEMNRLVVCNTLRQFEVTIDEAENGKIALEKLAQNRYDLLLMDLQMPVMNGIEATHEIRKNLKINTPIVALSANAFKSEIDICISAGMNDYVTKPFEEEELISTLMRYFNAPTHGHNMKAGKNQKDSKEEGESLYNLEKMLKLSRGNDEFITHMLNLFVTNMSKYVTQIETFYASGNIEEIKKIAHKMKPSLADMGISSIENEVKLLENYSSQKLSPEKLDELIGKVSSTITQAVDQIKKDHSLV